MFVLSGWAGGEGNTVGTLAAGVGESVLRTLLFLLCIASTVSYVCCPVASSRLRFLAVFAVTVIHVTSAAPSWESTVITIPNDRMRPIRGVLVIAIPLFSSVLGRASNPIVHTFLNCFYVLPSVSRTPYSGGHRAKPNRTTKRPFALTSLPRDLLDAYEIGAHYLPCAS